MPCSVEVAVEVMLVDTVDEADVVCVDVPVEETELLCVADSVDVAVLVTDVVAVVLRLVVTVELAVDEAEDVAVVVSVVVGEVMSQPRIPPAANAASAEFKCAAEPAHEADDANRSSNSPEHSRLPSW